MSEPFAGETRPLASMKVDESRFLERSPFVDDLLLVLRERAVVIALVFAAAVLGTYATLQLLTERFESQTSLLVKLGRENAELPATVSKGGFVAAGVRREELNSEVQMFRSRKLIEEVVDSLGPDAFRFEPPPPESLFQAVKYYVKKTVRWARSQGRALLVWLNLRKKLSDRENAVLLVDESLAVAAEKESDVITARLRLPDPGLARSVLELLTAGFLEMHVEVRQNENVKEFFQEQLEKLQAEIEAIDASKETLLRERNLSDVAKQRELLLQRRSESEAKIDAHQSERAMLLEERAEMDSRLELLPEDFPRTEVRIRNPSRETILQRITALKLEREQLVNRYHQDSIPVQNVDEQLAGLQALLAQEEITHFDSVTTETHPVRREFVQRREELNVRIAGLDAATSELRGLTATLSRRLDELNVGENQLDELLRERRVSEQSYFALAERMENARISDELDDMRIANVTVVTPPTLPLKAVYPNKLLIMALSFPVGLLLGIALALLLEYFTDTLDSRRDLESLGGVDYLGSFDFSNPSVSPTSPSSP